MSVCERRDWMHLYLNASVVPVSCLSPSAELANNRLRLYIFLAMLCEDFKSGRANVSHHCRSALAL